MRKIGPGHTRLLLTTPSSESTKKFACAVDALDIKPNFGGDVAISEREISEISSHPGTYLFKRERERAYTYVAIAIVCRLQRYDD